MRTQSIGTRQGRLKSTCSTLTSPVRMFTGSARSTLHFRKPGSMFLKSFCRNFLKPAPIALPSRDLASLPRPAKAPRAIMPAIEIVGAPPTFTVLGIARLKLVGSRLGSLSFFFFGRGGLGMPAIWQPSTGSAR